MTLDGFWQALDVHYGKDLAAYGPAFRSITLNTDPAIVGGVAAHLVFDVGTGEGAGALHFAGTGACTICCAVSPIELQVADGAWYRAAVEIINATTVKATIDVEGRITGQPRLAIRRVCLLFLNLFL